MKLSENSELRKNLVDLWLKKEKYGDLVLLDELLEETKGGSKETLLQGCSYLAKFKMTEALKIDPNLLSNYKNERFLDELEFQIKLCQLGLDNKVETWNQYIEQVSAQDFSQVLEKHNVKWASLLCLFSRSRDA